MTIKMEEQQEILDISTLHHFTPLLQKIKRNRVTQFPQKIILTKILDISIELAKLMEYFVFEFRKLSWKKRSMQS